VIGSVVGCGVFMSGWNSVDWWEMLRIAATWVTSPIIGGVATLALWFLLKKYVIESSDPVPRMLFSLPFLASSTIGVLSLFILYKGLSPFNLQVPIYIALPTAIVVAAICGVVIWKFLVPLIRRRIMNEASSGFQEMQEKLHDTTTEDKEYDNATTEGRDNEITVSEHEQDHTVQDQYATEEKDIQDTAGIPTETDPYENQMADIDLNDTTINMDTDIELLARNEERYIEIAEKHVFQYLVIMTSACIAVAHGANDISNASGPLTAIVFSYKNNILPNASTTTEVWITIITAVGLIFGLATLGYRVMRTIGHSKYITRSILTMLTLC
jgi:sodium-dependent phosphate transporter